MNIDEIQKVLDLHKVWLDSKGENGIRANLRYADLIGANLTSADLQGAILRDAILRDAILQDADLRDTDLRGANLIDANLVDANLRGADLRGANLDRANLRGADLTGMIIHIKKMEEKDKEVTMNLSEEEVAVILKMRADKINQAKIDARDIIIQVINGVTIELSNAQPNAQFTMQTDDIDEEIGTENLETIIQVMDLMGLKFLKLTGNRRAITFQYKTY